MARRMIAAAALTLSAFVSGSSTAGGPPPPTLRILTPGHCFAVGDNFPVTLWLLDPGATPIAGFQAFLHFDPTKMTLTSASYTSAPFGSPIITPIIAVAGDVDLAAGINVFGGQMPTTISSLLVSFNFTVLVAQPNPAVTFRTHTPPTTLSGPTGLPIPVITLLSATAQSADLNLDGVVNTLDLGNLLVAWSLPATAPGCGGSLACLADLNCDGFVNTLDLGILLSQWTL